MSSNSVGGSTSRSVASRSAKYEDQGGCIVIFLTDNQRQL